VHRRLFASLALFSVWFVTFLGGVALHGAIHLLLLAALLVFPWRSARTR
jgi:prolipoprotein diacylglyceryltransferase